MQGRLPYVAPPPVLRQEDAQHAQDGAALVVGDGVELRVHLMGRVHLPAAQGARTLQGIEVQGAGEVVRREELEVRVTRLRDVGAHVLHHRCEALVQPQVVPPLHSDEVPEPLVGHLVGDHNGHALHFGG